MTRREREEELSYLRRSIEDLDLEHLAGDIDDSSYAALRERYEREARQAEEALKATLSSEEGGALKTVPTKPHERLRRLVPRSSRGRLVTGLAALVSFVLAAVFLSLGIAGAGPFSSGETLSVSARVQIMLAEASVLGSNGEIREALSTYDKVLALRPRQPLALAEGGWLERLVGLAGKNEGAVRDGDAEIAAAARLDPGYAPAEAYEGVAEYSDSGDAASAVAHFDTMLGDRPSSALLYEVKDEARAAYKAARKPLPASIATARRPA